MRTEHCCLTIFGHDDTITQEVEVCYVIERKIITECKVKTVIILEPSDLIEDIMNGIRFSEMDLSITMDCEIESVITSETVRA